ncbi:N-acetylmuramoyl-L-alanine amidase [Gordonia sp. L191]|uniref:N-acetylmuramoyl-L-alanine amidase n=1 Tax=Gordonia sp. L191 TaxID=2982699 RepID=UPI0024C07200|nr:N-acetylmuramoyl-L-alanine amidase [Gordonia sp. L191]WHU48648.1 N-acetylmuramoyl-L-alanine amidase [Gordonia sp. L191]
MSIARRRGSRARLAITAAAVALLTGSAVLTATTGSAPASAAPPTGTSLAGKTIFLDPGHQGGAAGHDLAKQVPDGRGGTKDCQTTGATGVNGVAEHTVNWDVAQLVKAGLESQGARVVLSRPDDTGWGGCVDERAAAASRSGAAIAVSLHADSTTTGTDTTKKGFHMIVPTLPIPDATVNQVQGGEGRKASTIMRDAFLKAGFPAANYAGVNDGIQTRSDIAAVNLTKVPAVFIEMGNLSNPQEAAALAARDGQVKYSMAITDGIINYVKGSAAATIPGVSNPGATTPGTTPGTTTPGATTPGTTTPQSGDDAELSAVLPFIQQLLGTKDPAEIMRLMLTEGQDASAQVLNAMLEIVYGLFDGKLPIG